MNSLRPTSSVVIVFLACLLPVHAGGGNTDPAVSNPKGESVAWADLGAKATAQYKGGGMAIEAGPADTLRVQCLFQRLAGEVTADGLWLVSTLAPNAAPARFQVKADAVGRAGSPLVRLPDTGRTALTGANQGRYERTSMWEEYATSVDGVQQDFVVLASPAGTGELRVELAVSRAQAHTTARGVELDVAGRALAYSRLRVVDATGRELSATLEAMAADRLVVKVVDTEAQYPVRIDPTFSDANWVSMGSYPGADLQVLAFAFDGSGNLYIGGAFTAVGPNAIRRVAKWNGSTWVALGGGTSGSVNALAVDTSGNLYVGGAFSSVYSSGSTMVPARPVSPNGTAARGWLWAAEQVAP